MRPKNLADFVWIPAAEPAKLHLKAGKRAFAMKKEVLDMVLDRIALLLVVIGALNWGVIGLFGLDLVAFVFGGQMAVLSRVIYALVGLGGLWCISLLFRERVPSEAAA